MDAIVRAESTSLKIEKVVTRGEPQEVELSDLILGTFQARRQFLRVNGGARSLEILGSGFSQSENPRTPRSPAGPRVRS